MSTLNSYVKNELPDYADALTSKDAQVRLAGVNALGKLDVTGRVVNFILRELANCDDDPQVREAARQLAQQGASSPAAAPERLPPDEVGRSRWVYKHQPYLISSANRPFLLGQTDQLGGNTPFAIFAGVLAVVIVIAIGGAIYTGLSRYIDQRTFERDSVITTAEVEFLHGSYNGDHCVLRYVFFYAPTEKKYDSGLREISRADYERLHAIEEEQGASARLMIEIAYLPGDPSRSTFAHMDEIKEDKIPVWQILLGVAGIAAVISGLLIMPWQDQRRLIRQGQILYGTVESAKRYRDEEGYGVRVRYTFVNPAGHQGKGYVDTVYNTAYQRLPYPGEVVAILYLTNKIHRIL